MPVKTTFRGGGGKDRDPYNDPSAYTHHYPQVTPTGDGHQVSLQFDSSLDRSDNWRPFPKGTDTRKLGWKSPVHKPYDDPYDAVRPTPREPNPENRGG